MGDWLLEGFTFLGINFQNWMLIGFAIVVVTLLFVWFEERTRE